MTHPDLDGEITVDPGAVPHHERARWQVVPGQEEQGEQWPEDLRQFGGQQQVRMRHPDLDGEITIAESAVPFHREKGWQVIDPEAERALDDLTVEQLRSRARDAGLPVSGTKAELLERLSTYEQDQAGVEPAQLEEQEA
jgi:hypothetical protein